MQPVSSLNLAFGLPYQVISGGASVISFGITIATVTVATAAGGFSPYAYQWYRSTMSGFTPGSVNIVSGATQLTLNDTGLTPALTYYYVNVVTDNDGNTFNSNQINLTSGIISSNYLNLSTFNPLAIIDRRYLLAGPPDSTQIFPAKAPSQVQSYSLDFTNSLANEESVISASAAISYFSGPALNDKTIALLGSPSINSTITSQLVTGGAVGNIYQLSILATTNIGRMLSLSALLPVSST